jgi:membrane protein required for colicin V production
MSHLSLTAIDYVALAVILISAAYAMFRGLVYETLAIIAWLAAGYAALRLTPLLRPFVHGQISSPLLETIIVGAGIFLFVFLPLSFASRRIADAVKKSRLGMVDRVFGLVFGVGRGLVIVSLAYIAFAALVPAQNRPDTLTKARLFPAIRDTSDVLRSLLPGSKSSGRGGERQSAAFEHVNVTISPYGAAEAGGLDTFPPKAESGGSSR